jgi:hypothetical protein
MGVHKSSGHTAKARRYSSASLRRAAAQPGLLGISAYSVPERFTQLVFDWQLELSLDAKQLMLFLGTDDSACSWDTFVRLSSEALQYIRASYGFGGTMPRLDGPSFFSVGIATGYTGALERRPFFQEIERWGHELRGARRFERGLFRDVFPINVLGSSHLGREVGGKPLSAQIANGNLPGRLMPAAYGSSLWLLKQEELDVARSALRESGLLITS